MTVCAAEGDLQVRTLACRKYAGKVYPGAFRGWSAGSKACRWLLDAAERPISEAQNVVCAACTGEHTVLGAAECEQHWL